MILLEGVEVHVREDALKLCLRRHLEWLDEIVSDADEHTWYRWTTKRKTKYQQMPSGGMLIEHRVGQKRRFDIPSRTKTVAQNVLRAVKRRRAPTPLSSTQHNIQLPSQTFRPQVHHSNLHQRVRGRTPLVTAPPGGLVRTQAATAPRFQPLPPNAFQQQQQLLNNKHPSNLNNELMMQPPPPQHRIDDEGEDDDVTEVKQTVLVNSNNDNDIVSESDKTQPFAVVDSTGCEIFSSSEIESTLESIKNAEETSPESRVTDNRVNKGEAELLTPPPPDDDNVLSLEQISGENTQPPFMDELVMSAENVVKEEEHASPAIEQSLTIPVSPLPPPSMRELVKPEQVKIEPVEISDSDDDIDDEHLHGFSMEPQPGTSGYSSSNLATTVSAPPVDRTGSPDIFTADDPKQPCDYCRIVKEEMKEEIPSDEEIKTHIDGAKTKKRSRGRPRKKKKLKKKGDTAATQNRCKGTRKKSPPPTQPPHRPERRMSRRRCSRTRVQSPSTDDDHPAEFWALL